MKQTQKKVTHSIRAASILRMVICTVLLALAGLTYVYLKNQLHLYGDIQRKLERELAELRSENEVARAQIASLSSRTVLEKKLAKNPLGLVPIATEQIVRLNQRRDATQNELRVVANRGFN
jgi:cell division protein FtsB